MAIITYYLYGMPFQFDTKQNDFPQDGDRARSYMTAMSHDAMIEVIFVAYKIFLERSHKVFADGFLQYCNKYKQYPTSLNYIFNFQSQQGV